ncbi:MAG: Ig-like domain-containing protein [Treponema sp.]|nr:Ig-like domain-containing protein [Treponema sp.]
MSISVYALILSCGFADLREIKFDVFPENNSILPDASTPVKISFNTSMDKYTVENLLNVNSDIGIVKGDKYWNENELYFTPVSGWTAGIRYNLSFSGSAYSADGRELRVMRYVSFYAINKNEHPLLESFTPENGASIGTVNFSMKLNFSRAMERVSVESALLLDGISDKIFEWTNDDRTLTVTTNKSLVPWNHYRWTLRDSAKSSDGVPLVQAVSAQFNTDLDRNIPCIKKVYPVLYTDGCWYPTGLSIENGLGLNQSIVVEFNKPMSVTVLRSIHIEPSISSRTEFLTENSIICILTKNPEPETSYVFTVSSDAKDSEGLTLNKDFKIVITPDIPYLKILSITPDKDLIINNFNVNEAFKITASPTPVEMSFTVNFSLPFNNNEKQNAALKISLYPYFPASLSPVALTYIKWISDDRLRMTWDGVSTGKGDEPHFYKLSISGGKNGIICDETYLKENFNLILEAVHEKEY